MEGPDRESCEAVHREAHGHVACALVEVDPRFCKEMMGDNHQLQGGHVVRKDGSEDLGYRNIMVAHVQGNTLIESSNDYRNLNVPLKAKALIAEKVCKFNGRQVKLFLDDNIAAVFDTSLDAVRCALEIQREFLSYKADEANGEWNISFRIGLGAGLPLNERAEFFGETIKLAYRICNIAQPDQVLISSLVYELCEDQIDSNAKEEFLLKVLEPSEEGFITGLFSVIEDNLRSEVFDVEHLAKNIGINRPQLHRKISLLTGKTPDDFVESVRMDKALSLLERGDSNIAEVALEVGYNDPSHFVECFADRFGYHPSEVQ
jgi:AraC-like DNA-binding protein